MYIVHYVGQACRLVVAYALACRGELQFAVPHGFRG
jgi:hypothetical protein